LTEKTNVYIHVQDCKTYPGFKVCKDHITHFLYCGASGALYGTTCTYLLIHKSSECKREEQVPLVINLHIIMLRLFLVSLTPLLA